MIETDDMSCGEDASGTEIDDMSSGKDASGTEIDGMSSGEDLSGTEIHGTCSSEDISSPSIDVNTGDGSEELNSDDSDSEVPDPSKENLLKTTTEVCSETGKGAEGLFQQFNGVIRAVSFANSKRASMEYVTCPKCCSL